MNGLFRPTSGEVRVKGRAIDAQQWPRMTEHVGVAFQDPVDQIVSLTVLELPPLAELASALWTGGPRDMPIRLDAMKAWLGERLK